MLKIISHRIVIFIVFTLFPIVVYAHPHSFIDMKTTFIFNDETLKEIKLVWTFDEMTSADLGQDYQKMSKQQALKKIQQLLSKNIKENNYFSLLTHNKNKQKFHLKPHSSSVEYNHLKYSYHMILQLDKPLKLKNSETVLIVYEPSFYVYMNYLTVQDVKSRHLPKHCKLTLVQAKPDEDLIALSQSLDRDDTLDIDIELGLFFAQKVVLKCH